MEERCRRVQALVADGVGISDVVEWLRSDPGFYFSGFNLMFVLTKALGISIHDGYEVLACFDADLERVVSAAELDAIGRQVLATADARRWT